MGPNEFRMVSEVGGAFIVYPHLAGWLIVLIVALAVVPVAALIYEVGFKDGTTVDQNAPGFVVTFAVLAVVCLITSIRLYVRLGQISAYHRMVMDDEARTALVEAIRQDAEDDAERRKITLRKD